MFKFKKLTVVLFVLSFFISQHSIYAYVQNVQMKMNDSGNTLAVWQDELNTGYFSLFASVLPNGGNWTTPVNISSGGGLNVATPKISLNSSGNAVVIWTAYNPNFGVTSLYGAALNSLTTWSSAVQISDNNEHVNENYDVKLSDANDKVITWSGFSFLNFESQIRAVADSFANWPAPTTIAP